MNFHIHRPGSDWMGPRAILTLNVAKLVAPAQLEGVVVGVGVRGTKGVVTSVQSQVGATVIEDIVVSVKTRALGSY